jgi:hypothetical protein
MDFLYVKFEIVWKAWQEGFSELSFPATAWRSSILRFTDSERFDFLDISIVLFVCFCIVITWQCTWRSLLPLDLDGVAPLLAFLGRCSLRDWARDSRRDGWSSSSVVEEADDTPCSSGIVRMSTIVRGR